jgi:DNA-binding HxlR family transcriptional regulator
MNLRALRCSSETVPVKHYAQYCPIARSSEVLAERWTPIILRNLLTGCRTFGELQAGAPGISKALLAQRLDVLEGHQIITATPAPAGRGRRYELTEKGRALKAVTDAMGAWGARWLPLEEHDVDAPYVLWATSRLVDLTRLPSSGLVVRFELEDRPRQPYWLLLRSPEAEVCSNHPGSDEDLVVRTDSETLARWHLRHITFDDASSGGRLQIDGPRRIAEAFVRSIRPSPFAHVQPALATGR